MLSKIGLLLFITSCFGFNAEHTTGFFIGMIFGIVLCVFFDNKDKKKP